MIKTLPISEVRQNLPKLVDRAQKKLDEYIITVNGRPAARIMSQDEYESLMETLDILSEPNALKEIKEAEADIKAGRVYDLEDIKKELGWDV